MKILLPLAEGFEEIEATTVVDILRRAGIEVVIAGVPGTQISSARGLRIMTDKRIADVSTDEFDGIVLPGGNPGYINLGNSGTVRKILDEFHTQQKLIAAICAAPSILGKLGILDEKIATIFPGMEREIPKPRSNKVVVDGNVITSQGPGTAIEFALKIVEKLLGPEKIRNLRRDLVY